MKSVKESIENGRLICNCCGETIKPDEVAFDGKDALGNIVHICIDCDGKEDFIDEDFTEDNYADEIDDCYDSAEIFESVIKESTSDLTEEQKKAIQNMVQEDFEVGHPASDFNDIRRDLADDEMFNSNMNTIDAAAKYYIELVEMGPAGIMDEISDGWSDDYKAEYSDIFDDTGHERIGICPNCGHEITDEDEILDDPDESVIGKHACPRCDELYEDHEDLFESTTKSLQENRSCWEDFYKELMSHVEADNDPDSMIAAIDKIDRIHAKCGAFKNMDESDKEEVNNACDILAGASSYDLYQTFEAMSDYFGFDELVESAPKNKNHELHESVDKWQNDIDFEIRRCRAIFYYDSNLLYQVKNAFDLSFEEDSIYEEQKLYGTINGTAELIARWDLDSDDKVKAVYDAISEAKNASTDTSTDDDDYEKYNVYCIYDDDQGGEEDGDPRNGEPLNYEKTVELMKKLMDDFKNGKLSGSYRWSPTSDGEDCYLVIRAYPNCDTDTLIMKSYDWKTKYGFEMKAGEIYP